MFYSIQPSIKFFGLHNGPSKNAKVPKGLLGHLGNNMHMIVDIVNVTNFIIAWL